MPLRIAAVVLSCSIFLAVSGATARASGGELVTHLALLELTTDGVQDDLARRLSEALRQEVLATENHTLSEARVSLDQLSLVQDCDPTQPACLAKITKQLGVGSLIYGKLSHEGRGAYCELELYEASTQSVKRSARTMFAQRDVSNEEMLRKAVALIDQLFERAGAVPPLAPPGATEIELQSEYAPAEPDDAGLSGQRVAGYALLGGAALSVGLSVLAFVEIDRAQSNENFYRYRQAVGTLDPAVKDVCDEANADRRHGIDAKSFGEVKSECSSGRTFEVLQFVFLGAAALSGGLSAYFLLSEDGSSERKAALNDLPIRPIVRRNGAGLNARFKF